MARPFHTYNGPFKVKDLANKLGLSYEGDGEKTLHDVNTLTSATGDELTFLDNVKYSEFLTTTAAGAVICHPKFADKIPQGMTVFFSEMPYVDYARVLTLFYPQQGSGKVHPAAVVDETAKLGEGVTIGAGAYIGAGVVIGDRTVVEANATITHAHIGPDCIIHSGAVLGGDGFGFAFDGKQVLKVPQVGMVQMGDRCEIGACTTVDRGSLENTVIESDVKIDNLVQVAHNVKIGQGSQIVSQTGIAGSTKLGKGVIIGGQSGVVGHIELADGVMIAARSGVTKTLTTKGTYAGFPAVEFRTWKKLQAAISRLAKSKGKS